MNRTDFRVFEKDCYYLDLNTQPAHHMLRKCISSEELEYPCSYNSPQIKNPQKNLLKNDYIIKRGIVENNIEGFVTDTGPGKHTVPFGKCPEGYKRCPKTGKCLQVCVNCKYRDEYKSQHINEFDPCFPEGVYAGLTNTGDTKCTCGDKNEYCSTPFVKQLYTTEGSLYANNAFNPVIGDTDIVNNLYAFDQL